MSEFSLLSEFAPGPSGVHSWDVTDLRFLCDDFLECSGDKQVIAAPMDKGRHLLRVLRNG